MDSLKSADGRGPLGPGDSASRAIVSSFATAVERLEAADASARAGEVQGVHRLRTSARRLRSEIQAFGRLLDREWADRLSAEMRWLGGAIGEVRDLDVLRDRFETGESDEDRAALKPLFDRLAERHEVASRAMRETLESERFRALMDSLRAAASRPVLGDKAEKSCRKVLPPLVAAAWKRLRDDADVLASDSPDPDFHDLRKRAKRARYTTELIAPTLGRDAEKAARRLVRLARAIQDLLGEHQDAVVAFAEVEKFLAEGEHSATFEEAARHLLQRLRDAADGSRDAFLSDLRPKLEKKKYRGRLDADD